MRNYPNIPRVDEKDVIFGVTVDDLLSGEEILTAAEEESRRKAASLQDLVFGLLDLSAAAMLFLPLFGQTEDGAVRAVSLLALTGISPYLRMGYFAVLAVAALLGILTLALQNSRSPFWMRSKAALSLFWNAAGALLFVISRQPYAAVLLLIFLTVKGLLRMKK